MSTEFLQRDLVQFSDLQSPFSVENGAEHNKEVKDNSVHACTMGILKCQVKFHSDLIGKTFKISLEC